MREGDADAASSVTYQTIQATSRSGVTTQKKVKVPLHQPLATEQQGRSAFQNIEQDYPDNHFADADHQSATGADADRFPRCPPKVRTLKFTFGLFFMVKVRRINGIIYVNSPTGLPTFSLAY